MKTKKEIALDIYDSGETLYLIVATHIDTLLLPEHLYEKKFVVLKLSNNFENPVEFQTTQISTTLSFNKQYHKVEIPYESLISMFNEDKTKFYLFEDVEAPDEE
jgi:hypothetical protein